LEGRGNMELDDETVEVEPGMVIYIGPGTRHRVQSAKGIRTIVFSVPALHGDDEYFD
jgi:mannose-6-phosphate isomerase-like protein (cupin superfamily)